MSNRQSRGRLYRVEMSSAAQRDFRRLPQEVQVRLEAPILALAQDPRPTGVRKLLGLEHTWRIRVGPYRMVYDIDDDRGLVVVLRVVRRSEATYGR